MARQAKDVPSVVAIPQNVQPEIREVFEDIYKRLRAGTSVSSGRKAGLSEFRVVVNNSGEHEIQAWSKNSAGNAGWQSVQRIAPGGDVSGTKPVLESADGTRYRIVVDNAGVLSTEPV